MLELSESGGMKSSSPGLRRDSDLIEIDLPPPHDRSHVQDMKKMKTAET
jgi:hypothetical protein